MGWVGNIPTIYIQLTQWLDQKEEILCVEGLELDSGVSQLTIKHVRVLINPLGFFYLVGTPYSYFMSKDHYTYSF